MGRKKFGLEIFLGQKKIRTEKKICSKKFGSEIFLGKKNLGLKFFGVKMNSVGKKFG